MTDVSASSQSSSVQHLVAHCDAYRDADMGRAMVQLAITAGAFFVICGAMLYAYAQAAYIWVAVGMIPAALFLVRLFIIQHDCGHNSFTPSRKVNNFIGRCISILTFTPYDYWRRAHNLHHAYSGNLNRRGLGSIDTITVAEYNALSPVRQTLYRIFRHPLVLLVIGPPLQTFIIQRLPPAQKVAYLEDYHPMTGREVLPSILLLNLAIVLFYGALGFLIGFETLLMVYLPIVVLTSWIGGWLFFIQHQFENTYWDHEKGGHWTRAEAALYGSSYYVLPKVLQWFSGSIGLHHIHHLCAKIPNYRLQECLDANDELKQMNRLTIRESLRCVRWALWDEATRKMIAFRDLTRSQAQAG